MDVETIGSCGEDERGEKADRSEAEIRKPVHLRYCQEQIHVSIVRWMPSYYAGLTAAASLTACATRMEHEAQRSGAAGN